MTHKTVSEIVATAKGFLRNPVRRDGMTLYESELQILKESIPIELPSYIEPRDEFVKKFSFAIPSIHALKEIAKYGKILEVGCGSGYWAYELRELGVDIIATDIQPTGNPYNFSETWTEIQQSSGIDAIKVFRDRTLLLVWPNYNSPFAADCLKEYLGNVIIYCGEDSGGCCADDEFFDILDRDYIKIEDIKIPQWWGIHDRLFIFRRNRTDGTRAWAWKEKV